MKKWKYKSGDAVNLEENKRFAYSFFEKFAVSYANESIKNYEYLKDEVKEVAIEDPSYIVNGYPLGNDFLENHLNNIN